MHLTITKWYMNRQQRNDNNLSNEMASRNIFSKKNLKYMLYMMDDESMIMQPVGSQPQNDFFIQIKVIDISSFLSK